MSRDVTELRQLQTNMAALALRDPLTGLANRRLFGVILKMGPARLLRYPEHVLCGIPVALIGKKLGFRVVSRFSLTLVGVNKLSG